MKRYISIEIEIPDESNKPKYPQEKKNLFI